MARGGFFGRIFNRLKKNPPQAPPPREQPRTPPSPSPRPVTSLGGEVFSSRDEMIRTAVKRQKAAFWEDTIQFSRRASDRAVDEAESTEPMLIAARPENRSDATWTELASLASKAHIVKNRTGSAGELEEFLQYSFLWYHYLG